ncbi:MAG: hypothetical protein LBC97_15515 [Bifidobacteriaceae bacterium]|jgi:hypothetical protein|nr:hypothetical protein [Bifidobacteriaceae bacterium]
MNQDLVLARHRFPDVECRLFSTQFANDDIYVFADGNEAGRAELVAEQRCRLAEPGQITEYDLSFYRTSLAYL